MRRLLVIALAVGLLATACREQKEPDHMQRMTEPDVEIRASNFQVSVEAVLQDADRQIDQLATKARVGGGEQRELDTMLQDARRRQAALREDVQRMDPKGLSDTAQADIRRQLNSLQHTLEIAQLKTVRSRREFEREIQAHVEGIEVQIEQLDSRLKSIHPPIQSNYRQPVARLETRHRQLAKRLDTLQAASRATFGAMRRRVADDVAALKADVREVANEVDRAANRGAES